MVICETGASLEAVGEPITGYQPFASLEVNQLLLLNISLRSRLLVEPNWLFSLSIHSRLLFDQKALNLLLLTFSFYNCVLDFSGSGVPRSVLSLLRK